jgi:hypothetical protein
VRGRVVGAAHRGLVPRSSRAPAAPQGSAAAILRHARARTLRICSRVRRRRHGVPRSDALKAGLWRRRGCRLWGREDEARAIPERWATRRLPVERSGVLAAPNFINFIFTTRMHATRYSAVNEGLSRPGRGKPARSRYSWAGACARKITTSAKRVRCSRIQHSTQWRDCVRLWKIEPCKNIV